jgi:antitoxin ParD1/3/4
MNVSIGDRLEGFVDNTVKSGRYASASEVVREGLRLVEEREAKLMALRDRLDASIADPRPALSDDEVGRRLLQRARSLGATGGYA